jgi:hypothetical protein
MSFQFWIVIRERKFYKVKNFWLNMWMLSSTCIINQFCSLIFMNVSVKNKFIINKINYLHNNKFNHIFWDLVFKSLKGSKGSPQLSQ